MYLTHFIIEADTIKVVGFWVFWAAKSLMDEKKYCTTYRYNFHCCKDEKNHLLKVIEMFLKILSVEK